jgi:Capsule assembly protein Wzi
MSLYVYKIKPDAVQKAIAFAAAGLFQMATICLPAQKPVLTQTIHPPGRDSAGTASPCGTSTMDSPYISVDSWVYPAVIRLYGMGYASNVYLGMRPWTRASVSHMLEGTSDQIREADMYGDSTAGEAQELYAALMRELHTDVQAPCPASRVRLRIESSYSAVRAISGASLQDSFHLGSSVINDYGRPFEKGFNNYSGLSGYASAGRFLLYVRGEFQSAPSAAGYSTTLAQTLSVVDYVPFIDTTTGLPYNQATIPLGPLARTTAGRLIEAYASLHLLNHEVSIGKQDDWLGPGLGAGMAYSNNAENIYSFRINRIEPLHIPGLSRILGPFRYDFLVGSLKGHTSPNDPWVHVEKISFKPTRDLEFGFERTVIWGGKGHEPVTIHTFLQSFFSFDAVNTTTKSSAQDPGARFGAFDFTYRLPFPHNWLTLYTDMEAHDTVSPLFKPTHGVYRPGIYLTHFPGVPRLDLRVEAVNTDSSDPSSLGGLYQYWEAVQAQGYTNKGQLFGDWIGREDKGGQAWITYHLHGNEWIQVELRNQKASKDFISGGTTLNDIHFQVVKRLGRDMEAKGDFTYEQYKAPIYLPGKQTVTNTSLGLTWFPNRKVSF